MASFIGSNLQSLHYNFKHKIAGSTVENPLKIYSGSVNPSNLPAPTSTEWKEIKNQNFIDRLSQQDGNTVVETTSNSVLGNVVSTNAPIDGMMNIEIGGNTRYKRADGTYTDVWESGCTLESVGEAEGNKIEALTCGKNLFDEQLESGVYNFYTGAKSPKESYVRSKNYIFVKPNTKYITSCITGKEDNEILFYDSNKKFISYANGTFLSFVTPSNASYITFYIKDTDLNKQIQLEEGTTATPYKPYKEDKINILTSLNGLPNGTRDTASGDTATKKIGKMVLNGTASNWKYFGTNETHAWMALEPWNGKSYSKLLCDKLPYLTGEEWNSKNKTGVYATTSGLGFIINKGDITTIEQLKQTLAILTPIVYYELATPTIEKLPQPLTLQSFKSGTLQVNTAIPPYIKEWHTTNEDDNGVMQYQSGTTGLSQAFLTQIPLTSITNDIFGGSLPALKSAYKLTSNCDISAYGSGDNNGVETNNISYKVWNGTEYVLLNTGTSNVVSNINNILNNSNYVVDNNIYILMHTLPASDTIKSQINLDYFNANIDIARQPENIGIPEKLKNTYIPTNYTIFAKVACLVTNNKKIIAQYYKDTNNYIELNIQNNKVNFVKCINGVITTLSSNVLDYNKYQVIGVIAQQQNTGMKLSILKNNGECEHFSNTDVNLLNVATEWKLGENINITNQLDGFVVDYQFTDKTFTNTECEVMLKGRNTTGDITYDSFVKDYQNGKIQSGFILPNNKYKITGQVKLYYNDSYSRTVQDCEFVAKDDENKVELIGMAELVRVD